MTLSAFHTLRALSYPERCRQIGEILGRAAVRSLRQKCPLVGESSPTEMSLEPVNQPEMIWGVTDAKLVQLLGTVGEATPMDLCRFLGVSRGVIFRRLARLRKQGVVVVEGKTKAARYRLRRSHRES